MATDEGAAQYMATYGEGPGCPTRLLLGEFINDGESVLDVGCGPGWNFDHFHEFGPEISDYLGLDYSERFVRVANKRMKEKYGLMNVEYFKLGDVRKINQKDESFDVVILQDVLEHTNGFEGPVREALRVAKNRVVITFWREWRKDGDGNQINVDGNDGFGATYERKLWEEFLETLDYLWMNEDLEYAGRKRYFYVIDKEERHGA